MEHVVLKKMREVIGWKGGAGDSILAPGGAVSNLYAVMIARHKMFPEFKQKGLKGLPQLVLYTSEHVSNFSFFFSSALFPIWWRKTCLIALVIYVSSVKHFFFCLSLHFFWQQSHYSIKGAGAATGLGTDNVVEVPCDERFVTTNLSQLFLSSSLAAHFFPRFSPFDSFCCHVSVTCFEFSHLKNF